MPEDTLRAAMFDFSGNLLLLSLLASMVTASSSTSACAG